MCVVGELKDQETSQNGPALSRLGAETDILSNSDSSGGRGVRRHHDSSRARHLMLSQRKAGLAGFVVNYRSSLVIFICKFFLSPDNSLLNLNKYDWYRFLNKRLPIHPIFCASPNPEVCAVESMLKYEAKLLQNRLTMVNSLTIPEEYS